MKQNRAFTLIELLVVIAIIGLLSSVVLASLNSARSKARDARRISDLHQIQTALETYYDKVGSYPPYGTTFVTDDLTVLVPNYIPAFPRDPSVQTALGGTDYRYSSAGGTAGYAILAFLEKTRTWCQISSGTDAPGLNWAALPHC
ncbi:MAG: gspG [Parcubacteria group bacterium]|nr:gspG [Parcubacteria group bacterium]